MTRGDRILALVLAVIALVAIPVIAGAMDTSTQGIVVLGPNGRTVLDPSVDRTVVVEGRGGDVVVCVTDGTVRVTDSSCLDKVCVNTRPVGSEGGVIACVPNGVTVTVGRVEGGGLDAVVR